MTEEELELRRKEAAEAIQRYVVGTLKMCKTEDDITMALMYFGIWSGKVMRGISPERVREVIRGVQ